uniref:Uncharacterized protein n=1 Tax=viral metagenome TaxID=1070528 RepID=A0A6C0J5I0_9ZZZZ
MKSVEVARNVSIKSWNNLIMYIAYIFFYLDDTKFPVPLVDIMVND